MDKLGELTLFVLGSIGMILIVPIACVLAGAFSGWVVGLFFADTILGALARTGFDVTGIAMWQVGAAMGFFGGFLKTNATRPR